MANIMEITEIHADFPRIANEVSRTGIPITVMMNGVPLVVITPAVRDAVDVAVDFMEEYASVFEELAR